MRTAGSYRKPCFARNARRKSGLQIAAVGGAVKHPVLARIARQTDLARGPNIQKPAQRRVRQDFINHDDVVGEDIGARRLRSRDERLQPRRRHVIVRIEDGDPIARGDLQGGVARG